MIKNWISAARPRTLPTSIAPVILATTYAWQGGKVDWMVFIICMLFALAAQIASNFANDYFDYKHGSDKPNRVGPRRAVASGDISPKNMLRATIITLAIAAVLGCMLIPIGGWQLVVLGVVIILFALAYSAGPYPLSYHGLGEVTVFIFFGIIPVTATYWLQTQAIQIDVIVGAAAMGLLSSNILLVNNYRDYHTDKEDGKNTSVVILGRKFAIVTYLINGILATSILCTSYIGVAFAVLFLLLHLKTWRGLKTKEGTALNAYIGHTARNQLLFTIIYLLVAILQALL
ncbi:MAG: 1,4-dihydroxy-2-naphthoate octaprenyltransferase [Muribaculaceae bacterium]|nr:1,4-dihydroxy-2-naphthoate octaprenyltransferase [Muribaculaceae bacterium]